MERWDDDVKHERWDALQKLASKGLSRRYRSAGFCKPYNVLDTTDAPYDPDGGLRRWLVTWHRWYKEQNLDEPATGPLPGVELTKDEIEDYHRIIEEEESTVAGSSGRLGRIHSAGVGLFAHTSITHGGAVSPAASAAVAIRGGVVGQAAGTRSGDRWDHIDRLWWRRMDGTWHYFSDRWGWLDPAEWPVSRQQNQATRPAQQQQSWWQS